VGDRAHRQALQFPGPRGPIRLRHITATVQVQVFCRCGYQRLPVRPMAKTCGIRPFARACGIHLFAKACGIQHLAAPWCRPMAQHEALPTRSAARGLAACMAMRPFRAGTQRPGTPSALTHRNLTRSALAHGTLTHTALLHHVPPHTGTQVRAHTHTHTYTLADAEAHGALAHRQHLGTWLLPSLCLKFSLPAYGPKQPLPVHRFMCGMRACCCSMRACCCCTRACSWGHAC